MHRRLHARGGAGAGPEEYRHAGGRQGLRPGDLGHRAAGGTGLSHGVQPAACPRVERTMTVIILKPGANRLADWRAAYRGAAVTLDPASAPRIAESAAAVERILAKGQPIYGVNTGFGKLASVRIADADLATLQRNIVLSHAAGVGAPIAQPIARLMMALKLASLAQGASGVRPETIELLNAMLDRGLTPVIPGQGSVGASGDLAPLSHMAAT